MEVRKATHADIFAIKTLFSAAVSWQTQREVPTFTDFSDAFLENEIDKGAVFVAVRDKDIVGTLSIYESDDLIWDGDDESALYIHRLTSSRAEDGRGAGAEMVRWSRLRAASMGKTWLRVDCWATNRDLCQFYLRQGFDSVRIKDTGAPATLPPHYHNIQLMLFQMPARDRQ